MRTHHGKKNKFLYRAKVHDDFAIYLYHNTGLKVRDIFFF